MVELEYIYIEMHSESSTQYIYNDALRVTHTDIET